MHAVLFGIGYTEWVIFCRKLIFVLYLHVPRCGPFLKSCESANELMSGVIVWLLSDSQLLSRKNLRQFDPFNCVNPHTEAIFITNTETVTFFMQKSVLHTKSEADSMAAIRFKARGLKGIHYAWM